MDRRLWPLELSGIMTFGVLAILTLSTGIAWKERARLLAENVQLHAQIAHPQPHLGSVATSEHPST